MATSKGWNYIVMQIKFEKAKLLRGGRSMSKKTIQHDMQILRRRSNICVLQQCSKKIACLLTVFTLRNYYLSFPFLSDPLGLNDSDKMVPAWDADLNWRLKQLDSDLDKSNKTPKPFLPLDVDDAPDFKCAVCNETFFSEIVYRHHKETAHTETDRPPKRTLLCQLCDMEFESNAARSEHKRKAHSKRHVCPTCDIGFGTTQKLERHMVTHKAVKDFKCSTCGREFMIEKNLILHQKVHLGQKDYVCDICSKPYFTKSGLAAHHRQNHSAPNETNCGEEVVEGSGFVCVKCSEKFPTRYDLDVHRKQRHQLADDVGLKCNNCKTVFKNIAQLKRHIMNAHCERPFKCPSCPHRSKNKANLEKHMTCHSNKESFQCKHCARKFAFKNSLKKHLEKGRCSVLKEQQKLSKEPSIEEFLESAMFQDVTQSQEFPTLLATLQSPLSYNYPEDVPNDWSELPMFK